MELNLCAFIYNIQLPQGRDVLDFCDQGALFRIQFKSPYSGRLLSQPS